MIGETVGNFEIISLLGRGGWGSVYLAQQKNIKTKVAIKVLEGDVSKNATHVKRFFNEALAVSEIHHSGVVKIFDVGTHTNGQAYLVMEYLPGETLTARIKARTRLGIGMVADFGRQIASVLDATHNAGITHRDLKPDNIYLVHDAELVNGERVKVLDFGIAKLQQPAGGGPRMTSLNVSNIGTPSYMSPEQWHSLAEVDWRTDAYALGCVAFEMAVGRPPFVGESMSDVCAQHLTELPPVPSKLVPGLPPQLDSLVARLLEKDPAARPTMREAMHVFTELGHNEGIALTTLRPGGMISPLASAAAFAPTAPHPQFETRTPPGASQAPGAPGASQSMGASQSLPSAQPAPTAVTRKPRRIGLVVALLVIAIAGVVAAAVVVGGGGKPDDNVAKPGGTIVDAGTAVVHADASAATASRPAVDAAIAATAPIDAAIAVDAAVAEVAPDAAPVAVAAAPLAVKALPKVTRKVDPGVTAATTVKVCIDEHGDVTSVEPDSVAHDVRTKVATWRFEPYLDAGRPAAACSSLTLTPPAVATAPARDTKAIADTLTRGAMGKEIDRLRAKVIACGKNEITGIVNIAIKVDPDGRASAQVVNAPGLQGFLFCIDMVFNGARFPATRRGGSATIGFRFKAAQAPQHDDGADSPYGYPP